MVTFREVFSELLSKNNSSRQKPAEKNCVTPQGKTCTICPAVDFPYHLETKLKNEAFQKFWTSHKFGGKIHPLVSSPMGRNYRTNSKRRAFLWNGNFMLGLTEYEKNAPIKPLNVTACPIEPEIHSKIYNRLYKFFTSREGTGLSQFLNHAILKGNYEKMALILNLRRFTGYERSSVNAISKIITKEFPSVVSVFISESESSKYYQDVEKVTRIYGDREIVEFVGEKKFLYLPDSFSQTNSSIIPEMIQHAKRMLNPKKHEYLLDLYCGYGLFSLALSDLILKASGVEISKASIASAVQNAKRMKHNTRFMNSDISEVSIKKLSPLPDNTIVILDPPRQGVSKDVIEMLAANRISRALHIFCETDIIASELKRWNKSGYYVSEVTPLDMFPATEHLETMVLLEHR